MEIELITTENYEKLLKIYNNTPTLFLQNNGYEYIKKDNLSIEDKAKSKEIESILNQSIKGFKSFMNFRLSNQTKEIEIRFQYDYSYDDVNHSFTGVGYILLDELLNGFRD